MKRFAFFSILIAILLSSCSRSRMIPNEELLGCTENCAPITLSGNLRNLSVPGNGIEGVAVRVRYVRGIFNDDFTTLYSDENGRFELETLVDTVELRNFGLGLFVEPPSNDYLYFREFTGTVRHSTFRYEDRALLEDVDVPFFVSTPLRVKFMRTTQDSISAFFFDMYLGLDELPNDGIGSRSYRGDRLNRVPSVDTLNVPANVPLEVEWGVKLLDGTCRRKSEWIWVSRGVDRELLVAY